MRFRPVFSALVGAAGLTLALGFAVPAAAAPPHEWAPPSQWAYADHFISHDHAELDEAGESRFPSSGATKVPTGSGTSRVSGAATSSTSPPSTSSTPRAPTPASSTASTSGSSSGSGPPAPRTPSSGGSASSLQGTAAPVAAAGSGSGSMVAPLAGAISPTPRLALDYEYTWFTPGFLLTSSCSSQSSYGAWDAAHGYAGIVLDLGNPLGLQSRDGLAGAEAVLRNAENCFTQGFSSVAPHDQPLIYVGFSNCIGACGAGATPTSRFQQAGRVAAAYVNAGNADVKGAWLDVEGDWSTVAQVHALVVGYLSVNPAQSGRGQWCDSNYRNYASGLPNDTWTVSAILSQYISPLLSAGYTCLGSQRLLIPQDYNNSWLTNGFAYFSPAQSLAQYVGGITVCGAVESAGTCPDLGLPGSAGKATKWTDYAHDGYAAASASAVAVVGGGAEKIPI